MMDKVSRLVEREKVDQYILSPPAQPPPPIFVDGMDGAGWILADEVVRQHSEVSLLSGISKI